MKKLEELIRANIYKLEPYSCARNEYSGEASVFLDANENPYNEPYNRYPDPLQLALKDKIAKLKNVRSSQIMLGNGSDEPIDLVYRIFCEPKKDNVVAINPTYGMYKVCADINDVEYRKVNLDDDFRLDADKLLSACDGNTKVIWMCSPNNPSGNLLDRIQIKKILDTFDGIIVIDEAYIDFAASESWLQDLDKYPNLIILQTFSKAWGMASIRCGMAFASENIIGIFNKVKYPYNINLLTQNFVSKQLDNAYKKQQWVDSILEERAKLVKELENLRGCEKIYHTDANFVLAKITDADKCYKFLMQNGIIVRNRSKVDLCGDCLRITVGTHDENQALINDMKKFGES